MMVKTTTIMIALEISAAKPLIPVRRMMVMIKIKQPCHSHLSRFSVTDESFRVLHVILGWGKQSLPSANLQGF